MFAKLDKWLFNTDTDYDGAFSILSVVIGFIIFIFTVKIYDSSEVPKLSLPNSFCACTNNVIANAEYENTSLFD